MCGYHLVQFTVGYIFNIKILYAITKYYPIVYSKFMCAQLAWRSGRRHGGLLYSIYIYIYIYIYPFNIIFNVVFKVHHGTQLAWLWTAARWWLAHGARWFGWYRRRWWRRGFCGRRALRACLAVRVRAAEIKSSEKATPLLAADGGRADIPGSLRGPGGLRGLGN